MLKEKLLNLELSYVTTVSIKVFACNKLVYNNFQ